MVRFRQVSLYSENVIFNNRLINHVSAETLTTGRMMYSVHLWRYQPGDSNEHLCILFYLFTLYCYFIVPPLPGM
jgi:hypothetical protein